jgi:hypothetical protein
MVHRRIIQTNHKNKKMTKEKTLINAIIELRKIYPNDKEFGSSIAKFLTNYKYEIGHAEQEDLYDLLISHDLR